MAQGFPREPSQPGSPEAEARVWYQWYFNTERGRAGVNANCRSLCKLLWRQRSPNRRFTEETDDRTAPSFDNPDFVDVVIHSYRHRIGNAASEPRFQSMEDQLANRPRSDARRSPCTATTMPSPALRKTRQPPNEPHSRLYAPDA